MSSYSVVRSVQRTSLKTDRLPVSHPIPRAIEEPTELSIVVTAFNEEETLAQLYDEIVQAVGDRKWELIIVDDGSTDSTYVAATNLHEKNRRVTVIRFRRNFGKTAALSAGIAAAEGKFIVTMDGDLQDDPREIPRLLESLNSGYDLVTGWRRNRRDPLSKRFSSTCFNGAVSRLTGVHLHDMNCGLKACRADVARELKLYGELHRFVPVLVSQKGYRVGEVEVNHRPREHGHSKYGWGRAISALFDIQMVVFLTRYLDKPLRLFGSIGMMLGGIGALLALYLLVLHLVGEPIGHRPLTLLMILLSLSGLQLVSAGLIGEMLRNHSFQRQDEYSVETLLHRDVQRDS